MDLVKLEPRSGRCFKHSLIGAKRVPRQLVHASDRIDSRNFHLNDMILAFRLMVR
jgi:hypothetical protein